MIYSKKVILHFKEPKNMGRMDDPDGFGEVGNLACGDVMDLYIKVGKNEDNEEYIEDIKFETLGCAAAIASSSITTELAKGKTLKQALKIDKKQIVDELEGLPKQKIHCSILAAEALGEAIYNYFEKNDKKIPSDLEKKHQRMIKSGQVEHGCGS